MRGKREATRVQSNAKGREGKSREADTIKVLPPHQLSSRCFFYLFVARTYARQDIYVQPSIILLQTRTMQTKGDTAFFSFRGWKNKKKRKDLRTTEGLTRCIQLFQISHTTLCEENLTHRKKEGVGRRKKEFILSGKKERGAKERKINAPLPYLHSLSLSHPALQRNIRPSGLQKRNHRCALQFTSVFSYFINVSAF